MRKIGYLLALTACAALLAGCGKDEQPMDGDWWDAGYGRETQISEEAGTETEYHSEETDLTVHVGEYTVGVFYRYPDDRVMKLFAICDADRVILDCGISDYFPGYDRNAYIGKPFEEAFALFYEDLSRAGDQKPVDMGIIYDPESYGESLQTYYEQLRDKVVPGTGIDKISEDKEQFLRMIADSADWTENPPVTAEEEDPEEEPVPAPDLGTPENPAMSMADIRTILSRGIRDFTLGADVTLDVNADSFHSMMIDCAGHAVTVTGTWDASMNSGWGGIHLENPSHVDLSGFSVDEAGFRPEDYVGGGYEIVSVARSEGEVDVTIPEGMYIQELQDGPPIAPFEGTIRCDRNPEHTHFGISYQGPLRTYEEQQAQDTQVVTAILTDGDAYDLFENWTHSENMIWTEVSVDVGNVTLPNQEYMGIELQQGAKLKVSGTIAVTGGRLLFSVCEADQLDLTGLTLIKKHPSPDMVKITYNSAAGLNTALLQASASGGTIKFDLSDTNYNITIW